jgi:3D (Asp-Asp-Asp) domain-containing protein
MAYSAVRANGTAYVAMSKSTDFYTWTYMGMAIGNNYSWSDSNSGAPSLFQNGGTFYIYFMARNSSTATWAIGIAMTKTISTISSWTQYSGNPILTGNWSEGYVAYDPSVIKIGTQYYLYYVSSIGGTRAISLAVGNDPYNFTRINTGYQGTAVVIRPILSYVTGPEAPAVSLLPDGKYICLLTDWNSSVKQITQAVYSDNGITWTTLTRTNTPFITGLYSWDNNGASSASNILLKTNGELVLAFQGDSGSDTWKIGVASWTYRTSAVDYPYFTAMVLLIVGVTALGIGVAILKYDMPFTVENIIYICVSILVACILVGAATVTFWS